MPLSQVRARTERLVPRTPYTTPEEVSTLHAALSQVAARIGTHGALNADVYADLVAVLHALRHCRPEQGNDCHRALFAAHDCLSASAPWVSASRLARLRHELRRLAARMMQKAGLEGRA
jgi:hypothetical protein